ncbi:hypothetical protein [Hyphococcus lacteus]|uniref:DUF4149 domain-containing protein n=1 Tax=Hyphococcus lacteus TaxID=3143536 RepID=A0ABV3Z5U0_9PROT
MTGIQAILIVIMRLWAAAAFAGNLPSTLFYLPPLLTSSWEEISHDGYFSLVANMGLQLALAIFIWFAAPVLARRTIKSDVGLNLNVDARMLVSVGSFLIGFWLIIVKLPIIGYDLIRFFNEPSRQSNGELNHAVLSFQFWPNLAVVGVGLWIMLQPFRLADMFMYLRNVGSHQKEE